MHNHHAQLKKSGMCSGSCCLYNNLLSANITYELILLCRGCSIQVGINQNCFTQLGKSERLEVKCHYMFKTDQNDCFFFLY